MADESKIDAILKAAYYRPGGYQGAEKLRETLRANAATPAERGAVPSVGRIREWLKRQQLVQLHQQKAPPNVSKPDNRVAHFTGIKLNDLHMMDLLFMPTDDGYKYILTLVDAATRYKAARPLATKLAGAVAVAVQSIYDEPSTPLTWPKVLNVDDGGEFKAEVTKLFEKHGTRIRRAEPGNHRSQSFVESFNKVLAQRLFKAQEAKELSTGETNREWVADLPEFVKSMNAEKTRLLGMSPNQAVKAAKKGETVEPSGFTVPADAKGQMGIKKADTPDTLLPQGKYRIRTLIDRPTEGGPRRRATDAQWSHTLHSIERVVYDPKGVQPTLYFMSGHPKHGVRKQDLQAVAGAVAEKPPEPPKKPAPPPPPPKAPKAKAAPKKKYAHEPLNQREMIRGVPIGVSRSGRVIRAA